MVAIALSSLLAPTFAIAATPVAPNATQSAQAQPSPANRRRQIFTPPPAPKTGRAGNSRGTATRNGFCPAVEQPLTALIPVYETDNGDRLPFGLTTSDHPTLWFYLPYEITATNPAELRLETTEPGTAFTTQRTILRFTQMTSGVVGIKIPPSEAPLNVGQRYDWTFVVYCKAQDTSTLKYAELSLERIAPTAVASSKGLSPKEQVVHYASMGLWENALTLLAQLRSQSPQDKDLAGYWANLLHAIAQPDLRTKPIIYPASTQEISLPRSAE